MAINLGLTQSLGREISTAIVAGFFNQWASAVGQTEADPKQDYFMAVGGVDWDATKKSPKLLLVTNGTVDEIAQDFRNMTSLVGFFTVNISDIIRRLRVRAHEAGIDLSGTFFFPPHHPQFSAILTRVKRERDARIARLRRDKKKFAAAKARARRQDIAAAPRVKNVNYQFAMQEMP